MKKNKLKHRKLGKISNIAKNILTLGLGGKVDKRKCDKGRWKEILPINNDVHLNTFDLYEFLKI